MKSLRVMGLRLRMVAALAAVCAVLVLLLDMGAAGVLRWAVHHHLLAGGDALAWLRARLLFVFALAAFAAWAVVTAYVEWAVLRPLRAAAKAMDAARQGAATVRLPLRGNAEFIEMARSFNALIAALHTKQRELEARMRDLDRSHNELLRTQQHLVRSAKLASVGTLASGIAHEIGNPIAGILGLLDVLEDEPIPETARSYLAVVRKEVTRIHHTIADLLAYARPHPHGAEQAQVDGVVDQVLQLVRAQRDARAVHIHADVPAGTTAAMSPHDLTAVLLNLVLNAVHAVRDAQDPRVDISARTQGGWTIIHVTDNGPGVPDDLRDRIFEPFFSTKHGDYKTGSGLGLAMCRQLCTCAGGSIDLDPAHRSGARFTVRIPVRDGLPQ